ncbi:BadF/BadG/BcrA/BcrD ATPase family protein [Hamadaea sp.]|uniref:N-acetylglucosamine kinase n=1 Tax=Hamadaea sp. TaxID=2024425 RepID=UPI0025C08B63|nr:BadF/BadG/BcrA/BcrD ATPase family protein [Hamadaea sp.]
MNALMVGVDAGGTGTRAVVATVDGVVLGRGQGGPGNPLRHPSAAVSFEQAVGAALAGQDASRVVSAGLGVAGLTGLRFADYSGALVRLGVSARLCVYADAVTAFAAGTTSDHGVVLIAGTGAIAARVRDRQVTATADGLGWLLGDRGSGVWLGLSAVRSIAVHWPGTPFASAVASHAGVETVDELLAWGNRTTPDQYAALAPVVCSHALSGDPLAQSLVDSTATELLRTLDELGPPAGPVVLAGGLLSGRTPVSAALTRALARRSVSHAVAGDPALAAARLSLRVDHEPKVPLDGVSPPPIS